MDYGDIIRLIIFGFIFLSFFGGMFGKKGDKKDEAKPQPVRPTELSQSGRPQPEAPAGRMQAHEIDPADHEQRWEDESFANPEQHREEVRERYSRPEPQPMPPTVRPSAGDWMPVLMEQYGQHRGADETRAAERQMREGDITDRPSIAEELDPEQRPRQSQRQDLRERRRIVEGGDVLRRSLKEPATLERGFIVKEVLDRPLALRNDR